MLHDSRQVVRCSCETWSFPNHRCRPESPCGPLEREGSTDTGSVAATVRLHPGGSRRSRPFSGESMARVGGVIPTTLPGGPQPRETGFWRSKKGFLTLFRARTSPDPRPRTSDEADLAEALRQDAVRFTRPRCRPEEARRAPPGTAGPRSPAVLQAVRSCLGRRYGHPP